MANSFENRFTLGVGTIRQGVPPSPSPSSSDHIIMADVCPIFHLGDVDNRFAKLGRLLCQKRWVIVRRAINWIYTNHSSQYFGKSVARTNYDNRSYLFPLLNNVNIYWQTHKKISWPRDIILTCQPSDRVNVIYQAYRKPFCFVKFIV